MLEVPAPAAFVMPVVAPMIATEVLLLLHVPPAGLQLSTLLPPTQRTAVPKINPGLGRTITG